MGTRVSGMAKAVFAGSFDPPTYGHLDIIERAAPLFEELIVLVAVNRGKSGLFSPEERSVLLSELVDGKPGVSVRVHEGLVADFARQEGCSVLVRGLRGSEEFPYEYDMAVWNRSLSPGLETVFLPTDPKYLVLSSSSVKEIASFGHDISASVPPNVAAALRARIAARQGGAADASPRP
jgi:pantetheine-phosphate adenylyltransferase, bacterial